MKNTEKLLRTLNLVPQQTSAPVFSIILTVNTTNWYSTIPSPPLVFDRGALTFVSLEIRNNFEQSRRYRTTIDILDSSNNLLSTFDYTTPLLPPYDVDVTGFYPYFYLPQGTSKMRCRAFYGTSSTSEPTTPIPESLLDFATIGNGDTNAPFNANAMIGMMMVVMMMGMMGKVTGD